MSANIVHEINNPLSIISISNAVLLQKINKNDFSGALKVQQTIASSIERIDKIIKGLKKVSHKNEIGDFASFSLEYVLKETLDLCSELLKGKFIELKVEDFPDIKINCRPIELTQVFINLINNARDAIVSKDERWIEVGFRVDNKEKNLFIDVSDSGEGIPLDVQDKIMETFFTTKAVGVGTGLGLSLSKRIIEEHGGSISLDKKKDHTCFTICLPFI
jgi:signal transduction histidine kinase